MSDKQIAVIWVYPPRHGMGHHLDCYMAYYVGEEKDRDGARGWGQTEREARDELVKNPQSWKMATANMKVSTVKVAEAQRKSGKRKA